MRIHVHETLGLIWATEVEDLTRLSAVRERGAAAPTGAVSSSVLMIDGNHAWLHREILSQFGPRDAPWQDEFEAMVAYAERHGWVNDQAIRMHVEE